MTSGVLTLKLIEEVAKRFEQGVEPACPPMIVSPSTFKLIGELGQREAQEILSVMCAATRPIFGDILTSPPDHRKAANWFAGGPWPYTAPDPEPVPYDESWASVTRSTQNFWRSQL